MNKAKDIKDTGEKSPQKKKSKSFLFRYVRPVLDGSIISKEGTKKDFPFISFIITLLIIFISNTFKAQHIQREINKTKEEVQVLRIKSIYIKSLLMESTRPTRMAELVKNMGLKESEVPPQKIFVEK